MNAHRLSRWLLSLAIVLLAGCAGLTTDEVTQGEGDPRAWKEHRERIAGIDGWQISGKMGIRAPNDSGSGTLFWLQRQDYFDIRLSGPLGRGAARLTGRPDDVTLEVAGRGRFQAESPEALLEAQLGWRLPVSNLLWWVRGLPAPDRPRTLDIGVDGALERLRQDGWNVEYLSYATHDGYRLPERIKLSGQNLAITLVIKQWQPRRLGSTE
ncbi:lipoprotein insertase outer membrane protein LolB [Stutzerimonas urumqiensis]|uniref:lipoprotein insertase outer membrane protein LolB n=1 Tax=Stutzerimonas urumqiensis TaxID=638269 RepID=UPI000EAB4EB8|nr:lipoprotein insertase outer membrane protein LolB [Stutzerimonas urumqiensis]